MIYLDNNATTRVDPAVLEGMLPFLRESFGNPSSLHRLGAAAARALDEARERVAAALETQPKQIVFTSGGTEANNLAIRGAVQALRRRGDHVVTTTVEHASVRGVIDVLEEEGLRVTRVPVDGQGQLDADAVIDAVDERTILVSVMHVQNETGAVFPVEGIARRARAKSKKLFVHSDGVQACGKLPVPDVDLYTISGHKIHGPKGAGALRLGSKARVRPLLLGGGQERGLRSGTEALPNLVGLGLAAELAVQRRRGLRASATPCSEQLRAGIEALDGVINSPPDALPTCVNASFPGTAAEPLLHALEDRGVLVSTGSACHSRKNAKSPVLQAMGLSDERLDSALRFSLSHETTPEDIAAALEALSAALVLRRGGVHPRPDSGRG